MERQTALGGKWPGQKELLFREAAYSILAKGDVGSDSEIKERKIGTWPTPSTRKKKKLRLNIWWEEG